MNKPKLLLLLMAAMVVLPLVSGCDSEEEKTYELTVGWNISGFNTCQTFLPVGQYAQDEITFTQVKINIYEDETATETVQSTITADCLFYEQEIKGLDRGSYFVTVDAYGDYDGQELAFFHGESTASVPGDNNTLNIPLTVGLGQIAVNWGFNSVFTCGITQAGEVTDVVVDINGESFSAPCGQGGIVLSKINPGTSNTITARALDANGDMLYQAAHAANPFHVLPGEVYPASVVFK